MLFVPASPFSSLSWSRQRNAAMEMRGRTPKDLRILMREYAGHPGEQGTIAEYRMSCTRCVMREIDAIVIGSGISGL
ncbi:MAG TPA: hypothetical protein PLQ24_05830, partial [Methanothrix sp.]|nr:hypothetical protein [Methanothrix sp.]